MDQRPVSITSARVARSDDIAGRQLRYVLSMMVRTACFVAAVAVEGVLRWVFVAGALFLPYIAVVMANAGVQREPRPPETVPPPNRAELGGGERPEDP